MKDIRLTNIGQVPRTSLKRLSFYANGIWQFGSLDRAPFILDNNQKIYRLTVKFQLLSEFVDDPARGLIRGQAGDYVGVDRFGNMSLITQEQYKLRFPKRRKRASAADTSEKLKNPNYITEIVRGSAPAASNTTLRTTSTPSTGGSSPRTSGGSSGGGGGGY